jgi:hypothetical protein
MNSLFSKPLSTAIVHITWPCKNQGKFMVVGSVPEAVYDKRFDTEQETIEALVAIGFTRFQLNDCSWYNNSHLQPCRDENNKTEFSK